LGQSWTTESLRLELISLSSLGLFSTTGLSADLFVVLLEGSQILTGLGEFTFLHTLTDVPVDEGTLGIHEIELVVDAAEHLSDGSAVGDHAHGALNLGEVTTRNDCGGLVVNTALETGRAPVNELNGTLGLDGSNGGVDILGDDITTEHEAAGHVLAVTGVALGHHVGGLEGGSGDLSNGELLVVSLLGGDDGGIRAQHEVDTGVGHQVGLEFGDIDVQSTIETEGGSQGRDDLSDQTVEVGVGGAFDIEGATADVVDGLVVEHNSNIGVLEERVGREHGVVWLNDGGGDLGRGVDGEAQLGFLTVVNGETLEEEGAETRAGTTTNSVENEETLETSAVVSELADAVEGKIDDFLADGVVTTGVVVGSIFLAGDQLFRVEQLTVGSGADLIDDGGLEVDEDGTGDVLASTSLGEEGVEGIITTADGLVRGHLAVRLNTVLEAVKLPAGIADLDTSLTDVEGNDLTHV
jgi:hypothetical protein